MSDIICSAPVVGPLDLSRDGPHDTSLPLPGEEPPERQEGDVLRLIEMAICLVLAVGGSWINESGHIQP